LARTSIDAVRARLCARLQARRSEIEQAVLTRVYGVSSPDEVADLDPEYADGLRAAVRAALVYGLTAVERGEERAPPIPPALLAQARMAARNAVSLATVLRRYFAGYALLGDFLIEEANASGLEGGALKRLLRSQATLFDRLLATVSEEYNREVEGHLSSSEERRAERVSRLLAGEFLDTSAFGYDFDLFHLGAVAVGPEVEKALRDLARPLDCRLLLVRRAEGTVWAWLGSRRGVGPAELEPRASSLQRANVILAIGEPAQGLAGWRLTHRQARAALPIALRSPGAFSRYAEVALTASMLQDELLATSLRELYLVPLERQRDGGRMARETLRAYFAAERNISSAAAALGVNRNTVASRLRAVEASIGFPLASCAAGLEAALRLAELADLPESPVSLAAC
jgi:PucR C-terminal helix-turn-helix domain/GGDEF-like domain